jgi:glyoxylase-like metal-dependent hydrolase (beta-lactamase superfamily II)
MLGEKYMQVSDHIHALKIPFKIPVAPDKTVERFAYTYLIYGKKICLIDSGVAHAKETIFDYVEQTGRRPSEIFQLILTHSHPDHIGSAKSIKNETGCKIVAHIGGKNWIEDVEQQFKERPFPGFQRLVGGSVEVDQILKEGDIIELDENLELKVYHTPGHSKGSITLLLPQDSALFTGDAIPQPGDIPIYQDVLESVNSIKIINDIPGIKILLTSWSDPIVGVDLYKKINDGLIYLQKIHETVNKVAGHDQAPDPIQVCQQVVEEIGLPPFAANPLVAKTIQAHLRVREKQNLLEE